jgi:hypothetical protein
VDERQDQPPTSGPAGPPLARTVAIVGAVPAAIYGVAIDGMIGVAFALVLWAVVCLLVAGIRRFRARSGSGAVATEAELFEQLRMMPCAVCGAPTLLEACLDCTERRSHQHRWRRDGASPGDEPDDPVH